MQPITGSDFRIEPVGSESMYDLRSGFLIIFPAPEPGLPEYFEQHPTGTLEAVDQTEIELLAASLRERAEQFWVLQRRLRAALPAGRGELTEEAIRLDFVNRIDGLRSDGAWIGTEIAGVWRPDLEALAQATATIERLCAAPPEWTIEQLLEELRPHSGSRDQRLHVKVHGEQHFLFDYRIGKIELELPLPVERAQIVEQLRRLETLWEKLRSGLERWVVVRSDGETVTVALLEGSKDLLAEGSLEDLERFTLAQWQELAPARPQQRDYRSEWQQQASALAAVLSRATA